MLRSLLLTCSLGAVAITSAYSQEDDSPASPGPLPPPTVIEELQTPIKVSQALLAQGTPLHLRLVNTIKVQEAKAGDPVGFEVTTNLWFQDVLVIPRGTPVMGELVEAFPARRASRGSRVKIAIKTAHSLDAREIRLTANPKFRGGAPSGVGNALDATLGVGSANEVTAMGATLALPVLGVVALAKKGKNVDVPAGQMVTAFLVEDLPLDLDALRVLPPNDDRSAGSQGHVHVLRPGLGITANVYCNGIPIANLPRNHRLDLDLPQGYYRLSLSKKKPAEIFVAAGEDYYLFWIFSGFSAKLVPGDGEIGKQAATRMAPVEQKDYWTDPGKCLPLPEETASNKVIPEN